MDNLSDRVGVASIALDKVLELFDGHLDPLTDSEGETVQRFGYILIRSVCYSTQAVGNSTLMYKTTLRLLLALNSLYFIHFFLLSRAHFIQTSPQKCRSQSGVAI
jgi:hypothetical protein